MESEHFIEPLMYIEQPTFKKPKAYMQEQYMSNKKKEIQEDDFNNQETSSSKNKKEAFKDLSIDEKISYLAELPNEVPKIKCELVMEDEVHRGIILNEKPDGIVVRIFGKGTKTIKREKLKNINLIGF